MTYRSCIKILSQNKILLTASGDIKLLDFGLSKWCTTGKVKTESGSKYYMAPEVIFGVNTSKSDIWSLGCLMFVLLSGKLPFISNSNESVYEKAQEGEIYFEGKVWENISLDAKDLIWKMIDKDYHHRYNATDCLGHEWFAYSLSDHNQK